MKSSLVCVSVIACLLAFPLGAQTKRKSTTKPPVTTIAPVAPQKSSFDRFWERLKIAYFSAYSGSSLDRWDNYTLSEKGVKDPTYAPNLWNQVNFNFNYGGKMNFVVLPRFTVFTQPTTGHGPGGASSFLIEDALVGFQGVVWMSSNKKFVWWARPGIRLPTSRASRNADITLNVEALSAFSYDLNKQWQLGMYQQLRQWTYEQRYNLRRFRIFHSPYIQYAINDTNRVAIYYEHYVENRNNYKSYNGKEITLKKYWENSMLAWSHDLTPKFNVMPFIGYMLNAEKISEYPGRAAWGGAWISYTLK